LFQHRFLPSLATRFPGHKSVEYARDPHRVAGFPAQGEWNPTLEDAVYQTRGSGPLPESPTITTAKALSGDYDCRRVIMEGLLLRASLNPEQPTLVLQSGEKVFLARLADASDLSRLAGLAEDRWLRLEGVCVNSRREDLLKQGPLKADIRPGTFHLLVFACQARDILPYIADAVPGFLEAVVTVYDIAPPAPRTQTVASSSILAATARATSGQMLYISTNYM
jgi:hypothetical protein